MSVFLWAAFGSLAAEAINAYQAYQFKSGQLPARYRQIAFWIVRLLVACVAGGLAVAYGVDKAILAFHVGVACPLIVQKLANSTVGIPDLPNSPDSPTELKLDIKPPRGRVNR